MSESKSSSSGTGLLGLLGVAFVVLKLCKVIDWSWWYVTLPFWGGAVLYIIIVCPFLLWALHKDRKRNRQIQNHIEKFGKPKSKFQQRLDAYMDEQRRNKI